MGLVDVFIVNVAMPSIGADLHTSGTSLQLVVGGYTVAYAMLLITGARLGDLFGRRRMYLIGVVVFTLMSAACALAPNAVTLVIFRFAQGAGAAVMVPQIISVIQLQFTGKARAQALSAYGAVLSIGALAGLILGGVIVNANLFNDSWHPVFMVNVPIGIVLIALVPRLLQKDASTARRKLDLLGLSVAIPAVFLMVLPAVLGHELGWPAWTFACIAAGFILAAVFVQLERRIAARGGDPLLNFAVLRAPGISAGMVTLVCGQLTYGGFLFVFTLHLQEGLGETALHAGLTYIPMSTTFGLAGFYWRKLPARFHPLLAPTGLALSANGQVPADASSPQNWSYEEKVIGWAAEPLARYNYATGQWGTAYAAGTWPSGPTVAEPPNSQFCAPSVNHCQSDSATDIPSGDPDTAGLCTLGNSHCWWNTWSTWTTCSTLCGTQVLTYTSASARPSFTDIYAPDGCTTDDSGSADTLPANAVIVDGSTPNGPSCSGTRTWTSQGSMTFSFPASKNPSCASQCITYQGKIDFHQLGAGLGGHMWFSHMINTPVDTGTSYTDDSMTATWTPPAASTGWTRLEVHIPDTGATTAQANYIINLGNGQTEHRIVNQHWSQNTWIDLGSFDLSAGSSVSLSNYDTYVTSTDGGDVAFDAMAFIPTVKPVADYVALGDSYSAGQGNQPYDADADNDTDACHRSSQAYSYSVVAPGQSEPIEQEAAANGPDDFAFLACSGATTINLTSKAVNPSNPYVNTVWGAGGFDNNEPYQIDDDGYLDANTTLVSLTIGGNDARFAAVVQACIISSQDCSDPSFYLTDNGTVDPKPLVTYEPEIITAEQIPLEAVYQAIHTQAPNAKIVVAGYPYLFPQNPTTPCQGVATADQTWMNGVADELNSTISAAVTEVGNADPGLSIQFVDPRSAFIGHDTCAGTSWINGIILSSSSGSGTNTPGAGSFHPMAAGQSEYGSLINSAIGGGLPS